MEELKIISVVEACKLLLQGKNAILLDTRDLASFNQAHAKGATHLTQNNIQQICESLEFDNPVMLICYHGISSQVAAQYFINYGFEEVYSVEGGFEAWQLASLPNESS